MIEIGIVGAGVIGKRLLGRFTQEKDVHIRWICDIDVNRAKEIVEDSSTKITATIITINFPSFFANFFANS